MRHGELSTRFCHARVQERGGPKVLRKARRRSVRLLGFIMFAHVYLFPFLGPFFINSILGVRVCSPTMPRYRFCGVESVFDDVLGFFAFSSHKFSRFCFLVTFYVLVCISKDPRPTWFCCEVLKVCWMGVFDLLICHR